MNTYKTSRNILDKTLADNRGGGTHVSIRTHDKYAATWLSGISYMLIAFYLIAFAFVIVVSDIIWFKVIFSYVILIFMIKLLYYQYTSRLS